MPVVMVPKSMGNMSGDSGSSLSMATTSTTADQMQSLRSISICNPMDTEVPPTRFITESDTVSNHHHQMMSSNKLDNGNHHDDLMNSIDSTILSGNNADGMNRFNDVIQFLFCF